jgi:tetratricopeptide (TPR) repeat protein
MSAIGALPEESTGQRVGHQAQKCFSANLPDHYRAKQLDGDDDFGFDYQVQVMEDSRATHIFRAQLKGSTRPNLSASGEYFSVPLKTSTVRYYRNCTEAILLVLADLTGVTSGDSAKNCPLYFAWIHDELRRLNAEEIPIHQKSVTLRVPIKNQLNEKANLGPDLEQFRRLAQVGEALDVVAERQLPGMTASDRTSLLERIPASLARRSPALLTAIAEEPVSSWPEAPAGTVAWMLNEAASQMRRGDSDEAHRLLDLAEAQSASWIPMERAEHAFLMGRVHLHRGNDAAARDCFAKAASQSAGVPRHLAAWAEVELRIRVQSEGPHDFSDVISQLAGNDPITQGMIARLRAASGDYFTALSVARKVQGIEGLVAEAVIHAMSSDWDKTVSVCDAGLAAPNLRDGSKQLFEITRARARFNRALGARAFANGSSVVPLSGPTGTDMGELHRAYADILVAANSLRASGWPTNTELLADIWPATVSILGRQRDALPLLLDAAEARPNCAELQLAVETIASIVPDLDAALKANRLQPPSHAQVLRRVMLLHMAGKHSECVRLFDADGSCSPATEPMFDVATAYAILSAEQVVRPDLVASWEGLLARGPDPQVRLALLQYWRATRQRPLAEHEALAALEAQYVSLGKPLLLGMHLFMGFDCTNRAQAEKAAALIPELTLDRMLSSEAAVHLAQAYATLGNWNAMLRLSEDALSRDNNNDRFVAIEALALDKLGRTADALSSLRTILSSGTNDQFAINTYINIAVRCGLSEDAIATVESLVASAGDSEKRMRALHLLFNLVHQSNPRSERSFEIAWQVGLAADPNVEEQEGLFLILVVAATAFLEVANNDVRVQEFQQRAQAFFLRFPNSRILRRAEISGSASAEEVRRVLRDVAGVDEDRLRLQQKLEAQLQRGELPIPYAWRPRHALGNVMDVPTLWAVTKRSRPHQRQYHLTMAGSDWKRVATSQLLAHTPLLDLTTLLLTRDLGLLDLLFELFPRLAVAQETLLELNGLVAPLGGSPLRDDCISLREVLKAHLPQIDQPWAIPADDQLIHANLRSSAQIKQIVAGGSYMLYSDDALFRHFCSDPGGTAPSICTLDVLSALEDKRLLSVDEAAQKVSLLCGWRIGLQVALKYQVAVLPPNLGQSTSVEHGVDILRASPQCTAVFDEIWDPRKSFCALVAHAAVIWRRFAADASNRQESVAALLALWFGKVRLHKDAPPSPIDLLANLLLVATSYAPSPSADTVRALWRVYILLVAFQYGHQMDERKEKDAISRVGESAARYDHKLNLTGQSSLRNRLALGLTDGTSDEEALREGYNRSLADLAKAARR